MNDHSRKKFALILAIVGYSIFGFSFLFSKQALSVATPFVLLAVRFTVAFLIMNCILLAGKAKLNFKGKKLGPVLLLGFIQPVLYFVFENYGIQLSPSSFAGTMLALVPIISLVLAHLILKETIRPYQILCALLSLFGVFLTTLGQQPNNFSWPGFSLLLGAVFIAALFSVISRKISGQFSAFERTYVMFALGSITFLCIALIQGRNNIPEMILAPLLNAKFWTSVIFLAGASSVGAFLMLNYAMTHLDIAKASIFSNITTVISIFAGVLLLGESFGLYQLIGSAIIVMTAYWVNAGIHRLRRS